MRLIDADYLTTEIARLVVGGKHAIEEAGHGNFWINGLYDVQKIIDNVSTVEINTNDIEYKAYCKGLEDGKKIARPKGEWEFSINHTTSKYPWGMYKCSNCNNWNGSKVRFCPECGADMKGDKELYQ